MDDGRMQNGIHLSIYEVIFDIHNTICALYLYPRTVQYPFTILSIDGSKMKTSTEGFELSNIYLVSTVHTALTIISSILFILQKRSINFQVCTMHNPQWPMHIHNIRDEREMVHNNNNKKVEKNSSISVPGNVDYHCCYLSCWINCKQSIRTMYKVAATSIPMAIKYVYRLRSI